MRQIATGRVVAAKAHRVDPINLVYQLQDGRVSDVCDTSADGPHIPLRYEGTSRDLVADGPSPSGYKMDPTRMMFRLGAEPYGDIYIHYA